MAEPVLPAEDERCDANEVVFQALICAYLDHPGWRSLAEAVFEKHGYTPEEIRLYNDGDACDAAAS